MPYVLFTKYLVKFFVLYGKFFLFIEFVYSSVYVLITHS